MSGWKWALMALSGQCGSELVGIDLVQCHLETKTSANEASLLGEQMDTVEITSEPLRERELTAFGEPQPG